MKWTGPKPQEWDLSWPGAGAAPTYRNQLPLFSFTAVTLLATASRWWGVRHWQCLMIVQCSDVPCTFCSQTKAQTGPSFPKKKKVSIFKPRRTIPKGTVHGVTMHDPGSVWKLMSMKETKIAMHHARVCMCIQSTLPIEELKRQKTGENPIHKKSKINPALVKQFLKCTITI